MDKKILIIGIILLVAVAAIALLMGSSPAPAAYKSTIATTISQRQTPQQNPALQSIAGQEANLTPSSDYNNTLSSANVTPSP